MNALLHGPLAVVLGLSLVVYVALRVCMWWSSHYGSSKYDHWIPYVDNKGNLRTEKGFQ